MVNSRNKGAAGEREFCKFLETKGFQARRTQQYCGNTGDAADIVCPDLAEFHFEVKRVEKLNIDKALEQAIRDSGARTPVVAHRKNRGDWLITLKANDFFNLLR